MARQRRHSLHPVQPQGGGVNARFHQPHLVTVLNVHAGRVPPQPAVFSAKALLARNGRPILLLNVDRLHKPLHIDPVGRINFKTHRRRARFANALGVPIFLLSVPALHAAAAQPARIIHIGIGRRVRVNHRGLKAVVEVLKQISVMLFNFELVLAFVTAVAAHHPGAFFEHPKFFAFALVASALAQMRACVRKAKLTCQAGEDCLVKLSVFHA